MSDDLTVIIEENPTTLVFEDHSYSVVLEETNTVISVPQEITQVAVSSQDVTILTVAEQGPPGASGIGSGDIPTADQIIAMVDGGYIDVQSELQSDRSNIQSLGSTVDDIINYQLPNFIDSRFGEYFLQPGVRIFQPAAPIQDVELVNKAYVDSVAGSGGGTVMFPMTVSTTAPSSPQVGALWLDMN